MPYPVVIQHLQRNENLIEHIKIFNRPDEDADKLITVGENFIMRLYGNTAKNVKTIDELRFYRYNTITACRNLHGNFELASLPPTKDAAKYHIMRAYYQIQKWIGNQLNPKDWGWKEIETDLVPITTVRPPAPNFIMNLIFCSCKTGCGNSCSCRKSTLCCTALCKICQGNSCSNITIQDDDELELP